MLSFFTCALFYLVQSLEIFMGIVRGWTYEPLDGCRWVGAPNFAPDYVLTVRCQGLERTKDFSTLGSN